MNSVTASGGATEDPIPCRLLSLTIKEQGCIINIGHQAKM